MQVRVPDQGALQSAVGLGIQQSHSDVSSQNAAVNAVMGRHHVSTLDRADSGGM